MDAPDRDKGATEERPTRREVLGRLATLLPVLCLIASVCLNLYAFYENTTLKRRSAALGAQLDRYQDLYGVTRRLVQDIQGFTPSPETSAVGDLLAKYAWPLEQAGVEVVE